MKYKIFRNIVLGITAFAFIACSGDDENKGGSVSNALIGTWAVKNMACTDAEKLDADIITFNANNSVSIKHYRDETGYGIFKYDNTYSGSWSVDGKDVWMSITPSWYFPNKIVVSDVQTDKINYSPWDNSGTYATMEKYIEPSPNIYGYWEFSKYTGTLTKIDGTVLDIKEGSFLFHYLYFSKEELRNHRGYNGVILDRYEKSPNLINFDFDGLKIVIYKVENDSFLDGDFVVKSLTDDHLILHFVGCDNTKEKFDIDMYLNRVSTFLNQ